MNLQGVPQLITTIGALGTASFGLVDATKVFWGGVNHVGFRKIKRRVVSLTPTSGKSLSVLPQQEVIKTLKSNWFNGTSLGNQKSIAKSLIKLHLNPDNAETLAQVTNTDPAILKAVAVKQTSGAALNPSESDAFGRFDLIVTAMLDETYQLADQDYRNWTRAIAVVFSVGLAFAGRYILNSNSSVSIGGSAALMIGLLATPLAPIAKDLSTALSTAVNALQASKK